MCEIVLRINGLPGKLTISGIDDGKEWAGEKMLYEPPQQPRFDN